MNRKKILRNIVLAFLVLAMVVAFYGYREYNRKNESLADQKADFLVNAQELIIEFSVNEKIATTKYSGKILEVKGLIKKVEQDEKGYFTVVVGDTASLSSVRCSIDSSFSKHTTGLQAHAAVFIKGMCTGFNADEMGLGADVLLNRCVIKK